MTAPSGTVGIFDYGVGNTGSIRNMLDFLGIPNLFVYNDDDLAKADRVILPGVGSFDHGMTQLAKSGASEMVHKAVSLGYPILGICLGMQLLTEGSEEGHLPGMALVPGFCRRLAPPDPLAKVPHMGWNTVRVVGTNTLIPNPENYDRYYFVHTYHVVLKEPSQEIGRTRHGGLEFTSMFAKNGAIFGPQFHPEKSHRHGMKILRNFAGLIS